jgi:tetratricopeptide (TPR) repeat protein
MLLVDVRYLREMKPTMHQGSFLMTAIVIFCLLPILWTACKPTSKSSDELLPIPEIAGEAISFLGDTLLRPEIEEEFFLRNDSLLEEARAVFLEDSTDLNAIIWYGRRLAYLHRYKEAIGVYTRGILSHPDSPELYRHRGHRFITIRQPANAIQDLKQAATLAVNREMEVEPDGMPNKLDIPLSNLHFNIYYHLGLAWYFQADYAEAITSFQTSMQYANNPDLVVASTYWLYLTYLRTGDQDAAKGILKDIHPDMEIIENDEYLQQLLVFQAGYSEVNESDATTESASSGTQQYGISCWHEANGRLAEADSIRRLILAEDEWHYFGYIAAEADAARMLAQ